MTADDRQTILLMAATIAAGMVERGEAAERSYREIKHIAENALDVAYAIRQQYDLEAADEESSERDDKRATDV